MDIVNLTEEQKSAANSLNAQQLAFANLVLTKDAHGMSDADCYKHSGYKAKTERVAAAGASRTLTLVNVAGYLAVMRRQAAENVGLSLEKVDKVIHETMSSNIADYMKTVERAVKGGGVVYVPVLACHLQDLPREVSAQIQELKMTREGLQIKTYSRMEATRIAAQRLGGLTDKREVSGPGGGPIEIAVKVIRVRSRKPTK